MDLATMPFARFAHFCGLIKPAARCFSGPLIRRPATLIALGAALRGHLAAQQHRQSDEKGRAHNQRRSQRGEIGPHGGLLSTTLLTGLSTGLRTRLRTGRAGPRSRRARAVSGATPMLIFPGPVTTATACGCCPVCWALPTPGRETPPRPRHRSAKVPGRPPRPPESH
jgi:hypothetical protein